MAAERVFVGLGANLGDARTTLMQAFDGALQNDFGAAADVRRVQAAKEQYLHSGYDS